jgi:hypothetical protein
MCYIELGSQVSQVLEPRRQTTVAELRFGSTTEDVLSLLGAPSRVFYKVFLTLINKLMYKNIFFGLRMLIFFKDEDKMRIHSPHAHRREPAPFSDYFYNYFTLGLDALFDGKYHR